MAELEKGIQEYPPKEAALYHVKQDFIALVCLSFERAVPATKILLQRNEILLFSTQRALELLETFNLMFKSFGLCWNIK